MLSAWNSLFYMPSLLCPDCKTAVTRHVYIKWSLTACVSAGVLYAADCNIFVEV